VSRHQPKSGSRARVRMRPPRRKPIDPEAGIDKVAERARVAAVLDRLAPKIEALASEALEKRETHVLYVLDPHSVLLTTDASDAPATLAAFREFREEVKHDTTVAIFPLGTLVELVRRIVACYPHFAPLLRDLAETPPPGYVRVFVQIGHTLRLDRIRVVFTSPGGDDGGDDLEGLYRRAGITDDERAVVDLGNGPEGTLRMPEGFLKVLYAVDTGRPDMAEGMRKTAVRVQRVVGAAMAVEGTRAAPRSLDEVIAETLGMPALKAAVDAEIKGEKRAFERALDAALDAREVASA
jgi:hypothetical protein